MLFTKEKKNLRYRRIGVLDAELIDERHRVNID